MNLRGNRGITFIALMATVIILLAITGTIMYSTKNQLSVKKLDNLYIDIASISSKIDEYYLKYGEIPILCKYNGSKTWTWSTAEDDEYTYYVIDLEKLDGLTLNYGYEDSYITVKQFVEDEMKKQTDNTRKNIETEAQEVYIINETTHQIYFPKGITVDGILYCTNMTND